MEFVPTPDIFPPEMSIFLNRMINQHIQSRSYAQSRKSHQSGLHICGFILLILITQTAGFTSQMSPEYVLYSLDKSTDHV